jgi:hypothetical protein
MPASAEAESLSFSRKSGRSHFFDTLRACFNSGRVLLYDWKN